MTWSLIALVALAILPVVLALAFTGCGLDAVGTMPVGQQGQTPGQTPGTTTGPPSGPPGVTPPPPVTTPVTYHDAVVADKPVVYWRLDEASGTTAKDIGSAKVDGTYSGSGVTLGQAGALVKDADKAAAFDGTKGVVTVTPYNMVLNPPAMASFSLECWIKPGGDPTSAGWQATQFIAVSRDAAGAKDFGFELAVVRDPDPNPRVLARVGDGANPFQEVSVALPVGAEQSAWRHVVMTYNYNAGAKTLTLWVTSVSDSKTNVSQPASGVGYQPNPTNPFRLAAGGGASAGGFFAGTIDEFAFYNPALSDARVKPHFDASR